MRRSGSASRWPGRSGVAGCAALLVSVLALAACSGDDDGTEDVSVFTVKAGQCFTAPSSVKVQLAELTRTDCSKPHTLEAFAVPLYRPAGSITSQVPSVPSVPTGVPTGVPTSLPTGKLTKPTKPGKPSVSVAIGSNYPGEDVLKKFADGTCAQDFGSYVGVDYLDSSLFFTYLLPSARSWEQASDRSVTCFVTTTGKKLSKSVKGSKL